MLEDFKKFAIRGNVVDMAVGVVIGAAFGGIVTNIVNNLIMPPIGLLTGGVDFSQKYILLKGPTASSRTRGVVLQDVTPSLPGRPRRPPGRHSQDDAARRGGRRRRGTPGHGSSSRRSSKASLSRAFARVRHLYAVDSGNPPSAKQDPMKKGITGRPRPSRSAARAADRTAGTSGGRSRSVHRRPRAAADARSACSSRSRSPDRRHARRCGCRPA